MRRFIDTNDFRKVMGRVVESLRGRKWCMIGGRAVEVWVNPPQTPDIDILIDISPRHVKAVEVAMRKNHFSLTRSFYDRGMAPMWLFRDAVTGTEVDVIGAYEDVHRWAIERATTYTIKKGASFRVATAEDVVVLKANAACMPGRGAKVEHDIEAIENIARDNELDKDYIETVLGMASADWTDEARLLRKLGII